uniref:Uncharacterized protein LOC102801005 n=1 Tax=Saccoglossus kowalevskii TaxID=10224 RepID=A0ABM0M985_SACKO|nr:PREDICTED: uncharacterized protein LOC102801005 [Saccoglossus kowalevskii]
MENIRLFVLLICLNGILLSDGFCRRRTAYAPSWSSWLSWSGCSKICGPHGVMSRFREQVSGSTCKREEDVSGCNQFCYNGGEMIDNVCNCPGLYGGECCSSACAAIDNCEDVQCTTNINQYCLKCEYDRGEGRRAYEPVDFNGIMNRICEKRCSWRPDSKFCYPGICTGEPSTSCVCANGFSGDNCLQIDEPATVESCTVTFQRPDYAPQEVICDEQNVVYCRLKAEEFTVDLTVGFTPSDLPPPPYYVNEAVFGIIEATIEWTLKSGSTHTGQYNCFVANSAIDVPASKLPSRHCINNFDISSYNVREGDELTLSLRSKISGYIKLNNYDDENSVTVGPPILYSSHDTVNETKIIFDFTKPVHCISTEMPCLAAVMDIGSHYIRHNRVTVTWMPNDWRDSTSGINHYNYISIDSKFKLR